MDSTTPDVYAFIPDLWIEPLTIPTEIMHRPDDPQAIACPEYHRTFQQAGTLKRHMRQLHAIPYESEDMYRPLKDAWRGEPICSHCTHVFGDFYRLSRSHQQTHLSSFQSSSGIHRADHQTTRSQNALET